MFVHLLFLDEVHELFKLALPRNERERSDHLCGQDAADVGLWVCVFIINYDPLSRFCSKTQEDAQRC